MTDPKNPIIARPSGDTRQQVDSAWINEVLRKANRATHFWTSTGEDHLGKDVSVSGPSMAERLADELSAVLGGAGRVEVEGGRRKPELRTAPDWWYGRKYDIHVDPSHAPVDSTIADQAYRYATMEAQRGDSITPEQAREAARWAQAQMGVMRRPLTIPEVRPDATRVKSIGGPKR